MGIISAIRDSRSKAPATSDLENQPEPSDTGLKDLIAEKNAVSDAFACITFRPDGTILEANHNFLKALGYEAHEVTGRHHSIFVDPDEARGHEYSGFWAELAAGKAQVRRFRRRSKDGRDVFIQASYMPVLDESGTVEKIIKYASDITDEANRESANQSKLDALMRSQAVIEFTVSGEIVEANENFLQASGYRMEEIRGQHHRIFMPVEDAETPEYRAFWQRLAAGESIAGEIRRVTKGGQDLWLQASYNPLRDAAGNVVGIIKFATDITAMVGIRTQSSTVGNVVAESCSQMEDTISEISESLNRTVSLSTETEKLSQQTNDAVHRLSDGSEVIQRVVSVIRDLSEQTKLLALNATIESARAGEAGKGFSVVATEVKDLARQTREATINIAQSVADIRTSIDEVVGSTEQINDSVTAVNSNMTNIAAAVEEQSVTMRDLNRTARELAE